MLIKGEVTFTEDQIKDALLEYISIHTDIVLDEEPPMLRHKVVFAQDGDEFIARVSIQGKVEASDE